MRALYFLARAVDVALYGCALIASIVLIAACTPFVRVRAPKGETRG